MKKVYKGGFTISIVTITLLLLISLLCCVTPSILVTQEQNKGDTYFNQHNYPEAIMHYKLMLDASKKLGIYRNLSMEADVNRKIANGYEMKGDYENALLHVRTAMSIDSADKNLLGIIEDNRQEGKIYIYIGLYNRSIRSLEKSLEMSEGTDQSIKGVHQQAIGDNYLALGQLYSITGKSQKSFDYTQKSLDLFKKAGDKRGEMESNLTLGSVWSDYGNFDIARSYIEKSINMANELKLGTARHNRLMASLNSSAGEYEEALRYLQKSLNEAKEFRIIGQIIWSYIGLGDLYYELGDIARAERYYKTAGSVKDSASAGSIGLQASLDMRMGEVLSAREYFSEQGSITGEAISILRTGEIMIRKNYPDSAIILLEQAQRLFSASGNRQGISYTQLLRGRLSVDAGKLLQAKHLLDSAKSYTDFPETLWQAWFHYGRMYEKQNEPEMALNSYLSSISVIEKIRGKLTIDEFKSSYFNNKREVYDRLINLLLRMDRIEEAFEISEQARSRAFYDILAGRRINFRGALSGDLTILEQGKRYQIEKLYKLLQKTDASNSGSDQNKRQDMGEIRNALTECQREYEEILQKIKLENPEYRDLVAADPVHLSDIRKKIDPVTALLTYWISDEELFIWMITDSSISMKSVRVGKKDIDLMVDNTRRAINSNLQTEVKAGLKQLYSILFAPFQSETGKIKNLVIIPNGSLHFIPFQALMNERDEYLVERYNFTYAPSGSVYALCLDKKVSAGSRFMGMALSDVSVGNNIGLPGTEYELKRILPLFSDNISAFGAQGTETFVKKSAGNYNLLHFATHGMYNYRQPLYSFLLFPPTDEDDGRLNVWEVLEMNINSKLVTLSACETGLGNLDQGDELVGLSRAFLFAGSSSVIVSLWSVADYPTAVLMTNFYKYAKDHPFQEALALAQRDVIKLYPQPLYWSPFILIGNGKTASD